MLPALLLLAAGAGCGVPLGAGLTADTTVPPLAADPALAALVPAAVRADGRLTVVTDPSYPPMEFTTGDGATVAGVDIDLATLVAARLGLGVTFVDEASGAVAPDVRSGRADVGFSALTLEQPAVVDQVTYFRAGSQLAVTAGAPVPAPEDWCGRRIGAVEGSVQLEQLRDRSASCTHAGGAPVRIVGYGVTADAVDALLQGQLDALLSESPVVSWWRRETSGRLVPGGEPFAVAPYAVAVSPADPALARAVQGALRSLIADGTYGEVLRRWGVEAGAIPSPVLVAAAAGTIGPR